jgi:hypothetical protein
MIADRGKIPEANVRQRDAPAGAKGFGNAPGRDHISVFAPAIRVIRIVPIGNSDVR